jgi:hypothetical protein
MRLVSKWHDVTPVSPSGRRGVPCAGAVAFTRRPSLTKPTCYPGYDVIAVNPDGGQSCPLQVKSRTGTRHGFPINNFESDFVVFVANLPQGYHNPQVPPEVYVLPIDVVIAHKEPHRYTERR